MSLDDLAKDGAIVSNRDKYIGVYIGILAVLLAICSMGGNNATNDANFLNIQASNTWAFFQAKNARRQAYKLQADDLELRLATDVSLNEDSRKKITERVADYRAQEKKLTSEPEKKEGLDELFVKGKELERSRDTALARGPYFDYGGALLQIAIVLASIAIISGGSFLLIASVVIGALGSLATAGGFTLAFPLPC